MIKDSETLKKLSLKNTKTRSILRYDKVDVKCVFCKKEGVTTFAYVEDSFKKSGIGYCCGKCSYKKVNFKERNEKTRQKCLVMYGVENPSQINPNKNKCKGPREISRKHSMDFLKTLNCIEEGDSKFATRDYISFRCGDCGHIQKKRLADVLDVYKNRGVGYCCNPCSLKKVDKSLALERSRATNLVVYGCLNPMQNDEVKKKSEETSLRNCGYRHSLQSPVVKEKSKKTNMRKIGFYYPMQSSLVREKSKQTSLEKWGFEYPVQSPIVQEKIRNTNLQRRGVGCALQSPETKEKIMEGRIKRGGGSIGQKNVQSWIVKNFHYTVCTDYCRGAIYREIDILVKNPDGTNRLAIEYNGDYSHSEKRSGVYGYHETKSKLALKQKKCHLIHIFESEWKKRNLAVVSFLGSKLGECRNVRASKCKVKLVPFDEAKEFCELFHMQGRPGNIKLALGLYLGDELLSLATFSKPHRQNMTSEMHLSRFVTKPEARVHGGLSKLSKRAFQLLGPFVTFVHKRLSNGNSYEKAGYKKIKEVPPDYWYWDSKNHKTVSKQSRRKSAVNTPKDMTEREHALHDKLYRVWDCGKIKFMFEGL